MKKGEMDVKIETIQEQVIDKEKRVCNSSTDYKGKVPLRASTGGWKASLFIIAIEFSERLSYFGISTNLIMYLTKVLHQDLKTAAKNVNYWAGLTTIAPLLGGFLADAYTGRFPMILVSAIIYLMGLGLLTMSEFIPSLKPCDPEKCTHSRSTHEIIFFLAMYSLSVGTGGHKPCLESFGADQFDSDHARERKQRMSFFNWWNFVLCCSLLLAVTVIVYVQDTLGWGVADIILTVTMGLAIIIFYTGRPFYRYMLPNGSPLTPLLQVLVAAMTKRNLPYPPSPDLLYEVPRSEGSQGMFLCHTNKLRFLDKAAIFEGDQMLPAKRKESPWRLATVTKVEETKLALNVIPIWLTSLMFGICMAQLTTFFIKQSSTMNRKISKDFEIPPASISAVGALGMILCLTIYEKFLIPALRRQNGSERGINILQRIGIGMAFSLLAMAIAAVVERRRLIIVEYEIVRGVKTGPISMSVSWLAPQIVIMGIADAFTLVGLQEFFYTQVPDSMRSLGLAFFFSVIGIGSFLSSFLISIVDEITEKIGTSWFGKDLNHSRFDYFCLLLVAMSAFNLCIFVRLAMRYPYKNQRSEVAADNTGSMA